MPTGQSQEIAPTMDELVIGYEAHGANVSYDAGSSADGSSTPGEESEADAVLSKRTVYPE